MTVRVAIYLFDEVEILDFAGPFEVFSTASRVKTRQYPEAAKAFEVFTVAATPEPIHARGGLVVQPQYSFANHPNVDVLIIPGGVVSEELERQPVIEWIGRNFTATKITASVCTGAFLLAKVGLLKGKRVTTHWEDIPDLKRMFPDLDVVENVRWVDTGKVVTSAGISAGIDMSLHLVAKLEDKTLAVKTARQIEFDWQPYSI